jgi:chromosome segregation ATPase
MLDELRSQKVLIEAMRSENRLTAESAGARADSLEQELREQGVASRDRDAMLEDAIRDLRKSLKADIARVDAKVDRVDAKVGTVEAKLVAVDAKVATLDAKVVAVDAKVATLDAKVVAVDAKVDRLDAKVVAVDAKVDQLVPLDERVAALERRGA